MTFGLHGCAQIAAGFAGQKRAMAGLNGADRSLRLYDEVHQVPIMPPPIPITAGAGTLFWDGPPTGSYWGIRRLSVYGFTAGSVILRRNNVFGLQAVPFAQAGTATFGRGELVFNSDGILWFIASGITLGTDPFTGAAQPGVLIEGDADLVPAWLWPKYLGLD